MACVWTLSELPAPEARTLGMAPNSQIHHSALIFEFTIRHCALRFLQRTFQFAGCNRFGRSAIIEDKNSVILLQIGHVLTIRECCLGLLGAVACSCFRLSTVICLRCLDSGNGLDLVPFDSDTL